MRLRTAALVVGVGLGTMLAAGAACRKGTRHPPNDWPGIPLEAAVADTRNVAMGDIDSDGDLDIVLAKGRQRPLLERLLINDGKGNFAASDLGTTPDRSYSAALVDLDGDQDLDVVTSNEAHEQKLVYFNDDIGHFTIAGTWGQPQWPTRNASVADVNGDGRPDVIAANRPGPSYVCLNTGGGRFAADCIAIPAPGATTIAAADFDGDGDIDLAVPCRDGGQSQIHFNDGKAGFARTAPFGPADATARAASAADFNRDGAIDLVMIDQRTASTTVYLNDGKAGFTAGFRFARRELVPYAATSGDVNGDGHPDIVIGYVFAPGKAFVNDGSGAHFTVRDFGDGEGIPYGFALGDVNGDGLVDLVMARSSATNVVFLGRK